MEIVTKVKCVLLCTAILKDHLQFHLMVQEGHLKIKHRQEALLKDRREIHQETHREEVAKVVEWH